MCEEKGDILVDIPDEDVPELYRMYQKHVDWAPQACCAIDNGIKWRRKTGDDSMIFVSPNNCWKDDGTFFILMRLSPNTCDIFLYTLDEECNNLYRGLMETKRVDYERLSRVLFFSVSQRHYQRVRDVADSKFQSPVIVIDTEMFYVPVDEALAFDVSCPPEVYLDNLNPCDAAKVNRYWPHRSKDSEESVRRLIQVNGGVGLYLKTTDELVAWVVLGWVGQLMQLQVTEEHQGRGYASIVTRELSKRIAQSQQVPYGTVLTNNAPSLGLFKKLKFKRLELTHYVIHAS